MKFGAPGWFLAFALLPVLVLLFWQGEAWRRRVLGLLVAARLQPALAGNASAFRRRLRFLLLLAGLAFVFLALAQPRYGEIEEAHKSVGRDVLIAIDISRSMLANDLTPTRLARAKLAAEDLVGKLHGDRVGLIAFAGTAFLQAPLTVDYPAMLSELHELDTEIIPLGGTNIAEAIRAAADAFGKGESDQRALVLITDGEELDEDGVAAAREAGKTMRIFTVGVGSPEGTVIALPSRDGGGTEYLKSPDGQIVKSSLDEPRLRAIAQAAGGFYVHLQNGPAEMDQIVRQGLDAMSTHEADNVVTRRPLERYRWPLAAGLLCLMASMLPGERRRTAATLAALLLLAGVPAHGKNDALDAYERQDFPGALGSFEKQLERRPEFAPLQFDSGAAAYRSGDLDKALDYFSKALTTPDPALREKAEYNLGNTLLERGAAQKERAPKMQDLKNSIQHYDQVLKAEPGHENAKYNRELAQKLVTELEKPPPPPKKGQKDKQKKKDKSDKSKQEKGQPQDKQDGDDQSQEGKDQDGQQQEGKEGEPKSGEKGGQKSEGKDGEGQEQAGQPDPAQQQPTRNLNGKLADAPQGEKKEGEADAEKEAERQAEEDAAAASKGKMTTAQANALLDSLKSADDRVSLLNPTKEKRSERTVRDW